MNEVKYTLARQQAVCIAAHDADKLIERHDALAALLYIYLLRRGGSFMLEDSAKKLGESPLRIRLAAEALQEMGLLEIHGIPEPAEELPEYSSGDIQQRTMDSTQFQSLVSEVQSLMGRVLSGTELKLLFGIYDHLALPPEVILMLVSYCMERTAKKLGMGKRPSMRTIEREAYAWANREILTLELAEEHLKYLQRMESESAKIKAAIGISDRDVSSTERKYIESWVSLGFGAEALAIAYDRTVLKTGRLQWKYMNSIVLSWHAKGLHTAAEIRDGDTMAQGRQIPHTQTNAPSGQSELLRMEQLMKKMKNN